MAYTPTTWVNDSQPALSAENLNNIESGISALDTAVGSTDISAIGDGSVTGAISTLNNSMGTLGQEVTNGTSDMAKYSVFIILLTDVWVQGIPCIIGVFYKQATGLIPYVTNNGSTTVSAWIQLAYNSNTNLIYITNSWNSIGSSSVPTISKIIGVC